MSIGAYRYLLTAEGGTERGHTVVAARGRAPGGPFVAAPTSPLLSHRSTDHPVQVVGHADLVQLDDDTWAMCTSGSVRVGDTRVALHPRWVSPGLYPGEFSSMEGDRLVLRSVPDRRCMVVTRVPDPAWRTTTRLSTAGGDGRLVVAVDERHRYAVGLDGPDVVVTARAGELGLRHVPGPRPVGSATVSLECAPPLERGPTAGPDRLTAACSSTTGS